MDVLLIAVGAAAAAAVFPAQRPRIEWNSPRIGPASPLASASPITASECGVDARNVRFQHETHSRAKVMQAGLSQREQARSIQGAKHAGAHIRTSEFNNSREFSKHSRTPRTFSTRPN
ncbi:hypothetical protein [Burkholderia ubonensis]|uniref:hypothetical protein n=1 Tax=Burkholderia ubonensis TaxID=101571 RepID=UPI0012FBE835|nr:hypothetical protein [Burkholderia ubonensis]